MVPGGLQDPLQDRLKHQAKDRINVRPGCLTDRKLRCDTKTALYRTSRFLSAKLGERPTPERLRPVGAGWPEQGSHLSSC
jgi:hypothetical protein